MRGVRSRWNLRIGRGTKGSGTIQSFPINLLRCNEGTIVLKNHAVFGEGKDWEFGVSRGKPLHIEWINNNVLLYSTGNYIQYPVINHNEKEYKK